MTHADTARHTRDALAALWLPPEEVLRIMRVASHYDALSPESLNWLRRIEVALEIERQRQKQESPAGEGEASGQAHSRATISIPSVQEVQSVSKSNPNAGRSHTCDEVRP